MRIDLGVSDEIVLKSFYDALIPGGFFLIYNICPALTPPDKPFVLEIISGFSRPFSYRKPEFWGPYKEVRAAEFQRFQQLSKLGKAIPPFKPADGQDKKLAEQEYQKNELERSIKFAKSLGLGRK